MLYVIIIGNGSGYNVVTSGTHEADQVPAPERKRERKMREVRMKLSPQEGNQKSMGKNFRIPALIEVAIGVVSICIPPNPAEVCLANQAACVNDHCTAGEATNDAARAASSPPSQTLLQTNTAGSASPTL